MNIPKILKIAIIILLEVSIVLFAYSFMHTAINAFLFLAGALYGIMLCLLLMEFLKDEVLAVRILKNMRIILIVMTEILVVISTYPYMHTTINEFMFLAGSFYGTMLGLIMMGFMEDTEQKDTIADKWERYHNTEFRKEEDSSDEQ